MLDGACRPTTIELSFRKRSTATTTFGSRTCRTDPSRGLRSTRARDELPRWSHDGRTVIFRSERVEQTETRMGHLFSRPADGTGDAEILFDGFNVANGAWSPDGDWLIIRRAGLSTIGNAAARDILALRPGVDDMAIPLIATEEFWEQGPAISLDGRWLAYSSNETGRQEVFVRPFPDVEGGKWQVSDRRRRPAGLGTQRSGAVLPERWGLGDDRRQLRG